MATDEVGLLHLAETVEAGFPHIDGIRYLVTVERQLGFETQSVARTQAAGYNSEFPTGLENLVPDHRTGVLIGGNVDFKSIFAGVFSAGDYSIFQSAKPATRHPVKFV